MARGWLVLAVLLFLVPLPASGEPQIEWWTWASDAAGDNLNPADRRPDILSFEVAVYDGWLNLRLVSADPQGVPLLGDAYSQASFTVFHDDGEQHVRFRMDDQGGRVDSGTEEWPPTEWGLAQDSKSWHYHLWISLSSLTGTSEPESLELRDLDVRSATMADGDTASGMDLELARGDDGRYVADQALALATWTTIQGPDFAGGASVALDGAGTPHVAYYIYDGGRGQERGLYLASVDLRDQEGGLFRDGARWKAERVADVSITRDGGRDDQMRTKLAFDDRPHILYTEDPQVGDSAGTKDSIRYAYQGPSGHVVEDPTPDASSTVGPENVPDLAVGSGRVVATIPVGRDVHVQERADGAWTRLAVLEDTPTARVAIGADGVVHVVFSTHQQRGAPLYYASEAEGFVPQQIGSGVGYGWETPETDGSFALAVDGIRPVVLWNADERDREQVLAILVDGAWVEETVPLVPTHGNPQYTMRIGLDDEGRVHAAGGYGGADGIAIRIAQDRWVYEPTDRYDVWDMAVGPGGEAYFAYTEPHGGTTAALSVRVPGHEPAQEAAVEEPPTEGRTTPGLGALVALASLAAVAALRRR